MIWYFDENELMIVMGQVTFDEIQIIYTYHTIYDIQVIYFIVTEQNDPLTVYDVFD